MYVILGKKLALEDILVTTDVQSLYTNIPHTEGIQDLNRILEGTNIDPIKKLLICKVANLVLTKNYFIFNKRSYRQTQGIAMGLRMVPSYADIFMKYIEIKLIDTSPKKPKMKLRFIDDIFMIWGHGRYELENFIHLTNNLHPTIKFSFNTNEQEIPFLDTVICRGNNNHILTKLCTNPLTTNNTYFSTLHIHGNRKKCTFWIIDKM